MQVLNIFVRQDLKMRKGKMAAQVAHAVMKLLFDVTIKSKDEMRLLSTQTNELESFLKNPIVKINMVSNEEALYQVLDKDLPHAIITDSGRTEFHGVPTVTCAAQGIFNACETASINVPHLYGKDIKAKQIFIFNKDIPLSKELACELSVITCLKYLYKKMQDDKGEKYFDLSQETAFVAWIINAFAKIGLSTKTIEQLNEITDVLDNKSIDYIKDNIGSNVCVCIEPCYPDEIDLITGSLALI